MQSLVEISNELAGAVERAGRAVVTVNARPRLPSTGVHWRPGIVVTAAHTVRSEEEITITRGDGTRIPATLAGRDPSTDVAVLKVAATGLPVAELGDSSALRSGHIVLALGLGPSASWGIVSATGDEFRTWRGGRVDRLLRLDLTLYPGYSGGPLVDTAGRVVGINTSGLSQHMGLAIPVSTVDRVGDELLAKGHITRGYLGVGMQPVPLPEMLRERLKLAQENGVMVLGVEPGSPAARAGLVMGDVLVALGGVPVSSTDDVQALLGPERVGTTLTASIIRAGEPLGLSMTITERPRRGR